MKLINSRYRIKQLLMKKKDYRFYLVSDLKARNHLRILKLYSPVPDAQTAMKKAYTQFRLLRSLTCPSVVRPNLFSQIEEVDGKLSSEPEKKAAFFIREHIPGPYGLVFPENYQGSVLYQLIESALYLDLDEENIILTEKDFTVTQDIPPRLFIVDFTSLDKTDSGSAHWLTNLLRKTITPEKLPETLRIYVNSILENGFKTTSDMIEQFPGKYRGIPLASRLSGFTDRQLELHDTLDDITEWLEKKNPEKELRVLSVTGQSFQTSRTFMENLGAVAVKNNYHFLSYLLHRETNILRAFIFSLSEYFNSWKSLNGYFNGIVDRSETITEPEDWIRNNLPELCSRLPLALEISVKPGLSEQIPELLSILAGIGLESDLLLFIRTESGIHPGGLPGINLKCVDLNRPISASIEKIIKEFLGTDSIPVNLTKSLERHQAFNPLPIMIVLKLLISNKVLLRKGFSWIFSLSREKSLGLSRVETVPLSLLVKLDIEEREILSFLSGLKAKLGATAIAHSLENDFTRTKKTLRKLVKTNLVTMESTSGVILFKCTDNIPDALLMPDRDTAERWSSRLIQYALTFPAAHLQELLLAAELTLKNSPERARLLYSSFLLAVEEGFILLQCRLFEQIVELPEKSLSVSQIRNILFIIEPSRFQTSIRIAIRRFLLSLSRDFSSHQDRVLLLTKLAAIDLQDGNSDEAFRELEEALSHAIRDPIPEMLPTTLSLYRAAAKACGKTEAAAEKTYRLVIDIPEDANNTLRTKIYCEAATTAAIAQDSDTASDFLLKAEELLAGEGLDAQQAFQGSRGYVFLFQGQVGEARKSFERAFILAKSRDDKDAAAALLNSIIRCEERLPGYRIRNMSKNMLNVCERASLRNDHFFLRLGWGNLAGLYLRSLEISKAQKAIETGRQYSSTHLGIDTLDWYEKFLCYLTGSLHDDIPETVILPPTTKFLRELLSGRDPLEAAEEISQIISSQKKDIQVMFGLYLAMEAAAKGYRYTASVLAKALADSYRPRRDEYIPAWRLSINALLAPRGSESERAFNSAQILARQTDRLLLTWMVLRVRMKLEIFEENSVREPELLLLIEEFDRFIEKQLAEKSAADFRELPEVLERRKRLSEISGETIDDLKLTELRDKLAIKTIGSLSDRLKRISVLSSDPVGRSDLQWGLEAIRLITGASRVQVMRDSDGGFQTVFFRGFGAKLKPSPEIVAELSSMESSYKIMDNFGITPFGPRLTHIIMLDRKNLPTGIPERRLRNKIVKLRGQFLLVEMESPFSSLSGGDSHLLACFSKQIAISIAFSDLEKQTYYDSMTGSAIRPVWLSNLRDEIADSINMNRSLSVLIVDLDFFKSVNDTFGHSEGDNILKSVVETMKHTLRPMDRIGRLGGEEFGIMLPKTSGKNGLMVAERIRKRVSEKVLRPDRRPVTISIGIAVAPIHGETVELLINRADIAMYESKKKGRNRITMWENKMTSTFPERKGPSLLDTGDPGWDQMLGQTVLQLISQENVSLEMIVDNLRNALRCEYLMLETKDGQNISVGKDDTFKLVLSDINPGRPGQPNQQLSSDLNNQCLSVSIPGGGSLTCGWKVTDTLPIGLPLIFATMAHFAGMLLEGKRIIKPEPRKNQEGKKKD